jgi:hypothetical protein
VLFVAGISAAVTAGGLPASPFFVRFFIPGDADHFGRVSAWYVSSGDSLKRSFGIVLLAVYVAVTVLSYWQRGNGAP